MHASRRARGVTVQCSQDLLPMPAGALCIQQPTEPSTARTAAHALRPVQCHRQPPPLHWSPSGGAAWLHSAGASPLAAS